MLETHIEQIKLNGKELDSYMEKFKSYADLTNATNDQKAVTNLLSSVANGEDYKESDLNSLFSSGNFGMTQDQFNVASQGEQIVALLQYFSQAEEEIEAHKEEVISQLRDLQEEAAKQLETLPAPDHLLLEDNNFEEAIKDTYEKEFGEPITEEVLQIFKDLGNNKEISAEKKKAYEKILKNENLSGLVDLRKGANNAKALTEEISLYERQIEEINSLTSATERYKAAQ